MSENINKQLDKDMNKDMDNNIDKLELYSFVIYLYIYIQFYIYAFKHNLSKKSGKSSFVLYLLRCNAAPTFDTPK